MKVLAILLALTALVAACGDDSGLSEPAREWCTLPDDSEESAIRFDLIFEAGLELELEMDLLNAEAARLLDEKVASGMERSDAARAVSEELLETSPDYVAACERAYRQEFGAGG